MKRSLIILTYDCMGQYGFEVLGTGYKLSSIDANVALNYLAKYLTDDRARERAQQVFSPKTPITVSVPLIVTCFAKRMDYNPIRRGVLSLEEAENTARELLSKHIENKNFDAYCLVDIHDVYIARYEISKQSGLITLRAF